MNRQRLIPIALVVPALAAAATFSIAADRSADDDRARDQALEAARTRVPVLLTYDYRTLDQDLTRSKDQTTGSFGRDYAQLLDDAVSKAAATKRIATKAVLSGAGVVDGDAAKVTVLVFLTQTTTSPGTAPSVTASRVEVQMKRADGAWKIAGLTPR